MTEAAAPLSPHVLRRVSRWTAILSLAACSAVAQASGFGTAVEYYHSAFDHYFFTAQAAEAAALDAARATNGWARTGQAYAVDPAAAPGLVPVCRFFSAAFAPKSSHFFTADAAECETVKRNSVWQYEGGAFYAALPNPAGCPAGTEPLHRLYNNGKSGAPNHRYTTCTNIRDRMVASGWIAEGVTMCIAAASNDCSVDASTTGTTPALGSFRGNIVLGSPTTSSIKVNVFAPDQSGSVYVGYGTTPGSSDGVTPRAALNAGVPLEISLDGLAANRRYYYRLYFQPSDGTASGPAAEHTFHTARPPGSTFTFGVQGDSHPEREKSQFNASLYARTLTTAAADRPDFYLTIGDDFSVDTLDPVTVNAAAVTGRYTLQRPYLGLVGHSAPVFLTNGNHEQAARYLLDGTPNNVAVWAQNARNAHYSQPAPDGFYTGNTEQVPFIGLLRNYFAWTWGDALFVVIDPYWASPTVVDAPFGGGAKRTNLWDVTHGDAQYQWLKTTLEQSQARFKFVFAHHVMGTGRGGTELADSWEWGGRNANGSWGFTSNRPDWALPIHQLMAANRVTIFFQGHDHIWVRQQKDGVTYQTLSEPADPFYALYNADAYQTGDKLPNTGYTRVTVSPEAVKVEYVRTYLPADEGPGKSSGAVAFSYTLP